MTRRTSASAIRPARRGLDVVVRVPGLEERHQPGAAAGGARRRRLDAARRARRRRHAAPSPPGCAPRLRRGRGRRPAAGACTGARRAASPPPEADVYCAEAGTAARFLLAACAAGEGRYRFDAAPQLRRRPLALLLEALRAQGAAHRARRRRAPAAHAGGARPERRPSAPARRHLEPVRLGAAHGGAARPRAAGARPSTASSAAPTST